MSCKKKRRLNVLAERLRPGLSESEREFLDAAELGDEAVVRKVLENDVVSPDCEDTLGRTGLDHAIISGKESLVLFLFGKVSGPKIHQGLLCAVDNNRTELCEILLRHQIYRRRTVESDVYLYVDDPEDVQNSRPPEIVEKNTEGVTKVDKMLKEALMRAAIKNNFQIVQMIMLRAVSLEIPHDYFCSCRQCIDDREGDYMVFCNNRLDTFRALASPAYISLTEEDPIIACFHLSKGFKRLQMIETENQKTYQELDEQCQNFTLGLMDNCRSSDDVKCILSGAKARTAFSDDEDGDRESGFQLNEGDIFPLLSFAMRMEQKKFVGHVKCQAQVSERWFSGLQMMRYLNRFEYLMLSIPLGILLLPILSLIYVVAPWSKVTILLDTPLMRFLSYTCSYLSFLIVICLCKLQFSTVWLSIACDDTGLFAYILIGLVFLWIFGLIWEEVKQIYNAGAQDYLLSLWNLVDSFMLTFLLTSFTLDVVIPIRIRQMIHRFQPTMNASGNIVSMTMLPFCYSSDVYNMSTAYRDCQAPATLAMIAEWTPVWIPDPELLSDVLFSAGIILSVSRISFIMPANETFGTMLVSFQRTCFDLIKLFAMFALILLAFTCGIAGLYAAHTCQTESFKGFAGTLFLLVWSLLGFGPGEAPDLRHDAPMTSLTNNPSRGPMVVALGYILYGIYVFAALVVLMNLLIAVMSNTFQEIQDERDTEWKFVRTELWLTFIEPGCCVAPPFNVIPTPRDICKLVNWMRKYFRRLFRKCHKPVRRWCTKRERSIKKLQEKMESEEARCTARQNVMCSLVRRYILESEREQIEEGEDAAEDKLRRLIERVASKLDERIDYIQTHLQNVDDNVNNVQKGGMNIQTMQKSEIDLTQTLINTHEGYQTMVRKIWEDGKSFRDEKMEAIRAMREERLKLIKDMKAAEAHSLEDDIIDAYEDADFIPRTTIN
ncbi:short transient receptor potential channel 3-like [Mizuhopecten yessoensis]|uniref:Short transient receptor potential channel 7 n=1 Tax=Mizuhopecten yessoensis TaxID=6573 RepID=A0A210Q7W9_MIZYE|nr:short transient receptor potential channel 3-like [Mizuhopecten yessoensis]OWF44847.1 Short transient receptor potential channel 7 [Mizuhopecten yessoensis]